MKKLIAALSSISLIGAASTAVVACSNDTQSPTTPPTGEISYSDLEKNIKSIFETITHNVQTTNQAKFLKVVSDESASDDYELFNLKKLDSLFTGTDAQQTIDVIKSENKDALITALISDLSRLFPQEGWTNEINNTIATDVSLQNLYIGSPQATLSSFSIDETAGFEITKTSVVPPEASSQSATTESIYGLKFSYTKNFFYYAEDGITRQTYTTTAVPLSLTIGTEGQITNVLKQITTELPSQIFTAESDLNTQFSKEELQDQGQNFKAYGNISPFIADYVASGTPFSEKLFEQINTIIENSLSASLNVDTWMGEGSSVILNSNMFGFASDYASSQFWVDFDTNPLINSLLFKKQDNSDYISYDDSKDAIKQTINTFESNISVFKTNLEQMLNKINSTELSDENKNSIINTSYSYGNIQVSGLQIKLEDSNQTPLDVPTFSIPWTYSNSGDDNVNQTDDYIKSLYEALKLINEKFVQFGDDPTTTMLNFTDDAKSKILLNLKYNNSVVGSADNLKNIIEDEPAYSSYNFGTLASSSQNPDFFNNENYNFNDFFGFFTIYDYNTNNNIKIDGLINFKKFDDGRVGLGFAYEPSPEQLNDLTIEYKMVIGNTRIQVRLPFSSSKYNEFDQSLYFGQSSTTNATNFFGANNLTEDKYKDAVIDNWKNFLFFELQS